MNPVPHHDHIKKQLNVFIQNQLKTCEFDQDVEEVNVFYGNIEAGWHFYCFRCGKGYMVQMNLWPIGQKVAGGIICLTSNDEGETFHTTLVGVGNAEKSEEVFWQMFEEHYANMSMQSQDTVCI